MVLVKIHKKDASILVAVCNSDLTGEKFEDELLQLDLTSDFYKGKEKSNQEAINILWSANHVNLVGKKALI